MIVLMLLAIAHATGANYVMVAHNGIDAQVFDGLDVAHGTDKLSLYDHSWGATVNPNQFNILATVNDDRITAIRPYNTSGAVSIPGDGWVIAVNGTRLPLLSPSLYAVEDVLLVRPTDTCTGEGVPVIVFHDLGTTSTNFEAIVQDIDEAGYTTITQAELEDWMNGTGSLPAQPIMLTFDDGYDSHFAFGAEVLHDYGMVGTFFIITSRPGTSSTWATWTEIMNGYDTYPDAVELGCHSHAAHDMIGGTAEYLTLTDLQRQADLAACASALETHTGDAPFTIAWPFGAYDESLVQDAKDEGFTLIMTTWSGLNTPDNSDGRGHVRRVGLNGATGAWSTAQAEIDRWYVCDSL